MESSLVAQSELSELGMEAAQRAKIVEITNLRLGSMSSILNLMGVMHSYRSLGVSWTPRSYNAMH